MGLLSIVGRLDLNGAGFQNTLKSAERSADRFAGSLRNKFAGAALGFLGADRLAGLVKHAVDVGAEIDRLARKYGISAEQVQRIRDESDRTGQSFEELVATAEKLEAVLTKTAGNPVMFGEAQVAQLAKLQQVGKELELQAGRSLLRGLEGGTMDVLKLLTGGVRGKAGRDFARGWLDDDNQLTDKQQAFLERDLEKKRRRAALEKEGEAAKARIADLDQKIADEQDRGLSKEEKLQKLLREREQLINRIGPDNEETGKQRELELLRLNNQIATAQSSAPGAAVRERTYGPMSDSLTSVGNFLGANPNAETRTQLSEANRTLKRIESAVSRQGISSSFPL